MFKFLIVTSLLFYSLLTFQCNSSVSMSFASLLGLEFLLFVFIYALEETSCLSCGVLLKLDFADCYLVVWLNVLRYPINWKAEAEA